LGISELLITPLSRNLWKGPPTRPEQLCLSEEPKEPGGEDYRAGVQKRGSSNLTERRSTEKKEDGKGVSGEKRGKSSVGIQKVLYPRDGSRSTTAPGTQNGPRLASSSLGNG